MTAAVVNISESEEVVLSAESIESKPDRQTFIERMKQKLNAGLGTEKAEPVLTYAGEVVSEENNVVTGPKLCTTEEPVTLTELNWPMSVNFELTEGVRVARAPDGRVLMQLPAARVRNSFDTCLASDVVGIALDGSLIRNNQTTKFANTASGQLIGYARDGFPIYGNDTAAESDACGGEVVNGSYQYHISTERNYVIGCFVGTPAKFVE